MTSQDPCNTCPVCPPQQFINAGEDKTVTIQLTTVDQYGIKKPFDLTGATAITATFSAPTPIVKTLAASQVAVLTPAGAGVISARILAADSILMSGDINVQVAVTIGGVISIAQIPVAFNVRVSLFP